MEKALIKMQVQIRVITVMPEPELEKPNLKRQGLVMQGLVMQGLAKLAQANLMRMVPIIQRSCRLRKMGEKVPRWKNQKSRGQ